jgi:hypothetical protein
LQHSASVKLLSIVNTISFGRHASTTITRHAQAAWSGGIIYLNVRLALSPMSPSVPLAFHTPLQAQLSVGYVAVKISFAQCYFFRNWLIQLVSKKGGRNLIHRLKNTG